MTSLRESLRRFFAPPDPLKPGIYHYQSPAEDPLNYRYHLRLEPDGNGLLIINASTVLHLNQSAAEYAYHLVKDTPPDEAGSTVAGRYRISASKAITDYVAFKEQVEALLTTIDLDPVTYFGFDRVTPYTEEISAPYRLDCALTYQLPDQADAAAAPKDRVERDLTTDEWKAIIDKAWLAGIPHLVFTGGEPTMRPDLAELIEHAERNGQVTGLLTDGVKLSDTTYLNELLQAGLDHAMIVLQPDDNQSWEALAGFSYWAEVLKDDIFVAAHLTLTKENAPRSHQLLEKLLQAGVSAVSLSAKDPELNDELQDARSHADDLDLELIWDLPVPYSNLNPVARELEMGESQPADPAYQLGWLYVEPDGDVLLSQGIDKPLGNLLNNDWADVWEKARQA